MNKCLQCNKEITQTSGKKARLYCNDACRIAYKRTIKSEQTITEQPEQVISEQTGKCHGCGKDVKDYICICYECFKNGITHATQRA